MVFSRWAISVTASMTWASVGALAFGAGVAAGALPRPAPPDFGLEVATGNGTEPGAKAADTAAGRDDMPPSRLPLSWAPTLRALRTGEVCGRVVSANKGFAPSSSPLEAAVIKGSPSPAARS
eukprot:4111665-Amphidinium_carterae.2